MAHNDTHDIISKLHAIGEDKPYEGKQGAKFYLQNIDDRVKDLDKSKNDPTAIVDIAFQIQNSADDLRKNLGMEPTNIREMFNKEAEDKTETTIKDLQNLLIEMQGASFEKLTDAQAIKAQELLDIVDEFNSMLKGKDQ